MSSRKLAALLGKEVATAKVQQDKNTEPRRKLRLKGYQLPSEADEKIDLGQVDVSSLYRMHKEMPDLAQTRFSVVASDKRTQTLRKHKTFNLLVDVTHTIFSVGEYTELFFALYCDDTAKFLSDEFLVRVTDKGMHELAPRDVRAVFKDLTRDDLTSRLYLVCRIYRIGALKLSDKKDKYKHKFRRPWGVAVLPVSTQILDILFSGPSVAHEPPQMQIYVPTEEKGFLNLHRRIIHESASVDDKNTPFSKAKNALGIGLVLRLVPGNIRNPSVAALLPKDDFIVSDIAKRKFVGTSPGEDVHRLRLILNEGSFVAGMGRKTSEKNVQVTVTLRDSQRRPVENCIFRGQGPFVKKVTHFPCAVYYHYNNVVLDELLYVELPPQKLMEQCHIFFEFAHCSTKEKVPTPFSFSFLPVINPRIFTVIRNANYRLSVYEYNKKHMTPHSDYLLIDEELKEKLVTKDTLVMETELRSTRISQDVDVHQLLNWHRSPRDQRATVLKMISNKSANELCQSLGALTDKLLDILSSSNRDYVEHHKNVFATLCHLLATVGGSSPEEQFDESKQFADPSQPLQFPKPYLEVTVHKKNQSPLVWKPIMKFWGELLVWGAGPDAKDQGAHAVMLRDSMAGGYYLIHLMCQSFVSFLDKAYPITAAAPNGSADRLSKLNTFGEKLYGLLDNLYLVLQRRDQAYMTSIQRDFAANVRPVFNSLTLVLPTPKVIAVALHVLASLNMDDNVLCLLKLNVMRHLLHKNVLEPMGLRKRDPAEEKSPMPSHATTERWRQEFLPQVVKHLYLHFTRAERQDDVFNIEERFAELLGNSTDKSGDDDWGLQSRVRSATYLSTTKAHPLPPPSNNDVTVEDVTLKQELYSVLLFQEVLFVLLKLRAGNAAEKAEADEIADDIAAVCPELFRVAMNFIEPEEDNADDDAPVTPSSSSSGGSNPSTGGRALKSSGQSAPSAGHRRVQSRAMTGLNRSGTSSSLLSEDDQKRPLNRAESKARLNPTQLKRSQTSAALDLSVSQASHSGPMLDFRGHMLPPDLVDADHTHLCVNTVLSLMRLMDRTQFEKLLFSLDMEKKPAPPRYMERKDDDDDDDAPPPPPPADISPDTDPATLATLLPPPPPSAGGLLQSMPMTSKAVFDLLTRACRLTFFLVDMSTFPKHWVLLRALELQMGNHIVEWATPTLLKYYTRVSPDSKTLPVSKDTHHRGSVMVLQPLKGDLMQETEAWWAYWLLATSMLLCPDLQLERLPKARGELIKDKVSDVRESLSKALQDTWDKFSAKQVQFIELLVAPILDLTQSASEGVRKLGQNMYWDLLARGLKKPEVLRSLQSHTIDAVGVVVHNFGIGRVEKIQIEKYRQFFSGYLSQRIDSVADLSADAKTGASNFLSDIDELFGHLVALESLPSHEKFEDERTHACLNLMRYLKESDKVTMHEMYIQYLCELHDSLGNHVEHGLALMMHAKTLSWSAQRLGRLNVLNVKQTSGSSSRRVAVYLPESTEAERKLILMARAIGCFRKAQDWERCVEVSRELVEAYEHKTLAMAKIPAELRNQASYFEQIMGTDRIFHSFYRVKYYGKDMDNMKESVYRAWANVRDFSASVKAKFPLATIKNSSEDFTAEQIADANAKGTQLILITTLNCSSMAEMNGLEEAKSDLPPRMVKYKQNNNVNVFTYTHARKNKAATSAVNEYAALLVERTFLVTAEPFPCLRRRVEVVDRKVANLSPIESAVHSLRTKNEELHSTIYNISFDIEAGKNPDINQLSMLLSGVIDAAVQGGINKYREAFFTSSYLKEHPEDAGHVVAFKIVLAEQLPLLREGLKLFGSRCGDALRPLYDHLKGLFGKMVANLEVLIGKK